MPRGRKKGSKNKKGRKIKPPKPPRIKKPKKIRKKKITIFDMVVDDNPNKLFMGEEKLKPYAHKTQWKRVKNRHRWCTVFFRRKNPLATIRNVLAAEKTHGKKASRLGSKITKIMNKRVFARKRANFLANKSRILGVRKAAKILRRNRFKSSARNVNRFLAKRTKQYVRKAKGAAYRGQDLDNDDNYN